MRPILRALRRAPARRTAVSLPSLLGLLLFGALALPRPGTAQQPVPTPMDVRPAPDSIQAMMNEYQEKARRYTDIYNRAFEANTDLRTRETEINDLILSALIETHPPAEQQMARLDAIETEAFNAQQAQDMVKLGALIQEANGLQADLRAAQEVVLQREDVRTRIDSFEADLAVAMTAVDPEANSLRVRLDELQAILDRVQGPGF
jgi:hypothetical protein